MEFRTLQYFMTIVEEENISRAADVLHVTQPTLSRQIAQLEEELGTTLFTRGKRLVLTDAGMLFLKRAEEIVTLMEKLEDAFRMEDELSGVVSIGSGGLGSVNLLVRAMAEFRELYPNVHYEFYANNAEYVKEQLDHGLLDFGLLLEPIDITKYDFIRMPGKERWGILMPAGDPLAKKPYLTREDVLQLPLAVSSRTVIQKELESWLHEDLQNLNIFTYHNMVNNAAYMVAEGVTYSFAVEGAVSLFDHEKLVFRPLYPEVSMHTVLAWKKFKPFSVAPSRFLEFFRNVADCKSGETL